MIRAGFGIRLGAAAIDLVLVYVIQFLASALVIPAIMAFAGSGPPRYAPLVALSAASALSIAYTLTDVFGARTPGKRMLKLRIAAEADPYARPPLGRLLARWAFKYSPMLGSFVAGAVMFWVLARSANDPRALQRAILVPNMIVGLLALIVLGGFLATLARSRQALHDLLAGTVVLRPGEEPQGFAPVMAIPVGQIAAAPPPLNSASAGAEAGRP
jgi:uncharacterized RDD family membrane protein YckC